MKVALETTTVTEDRLTRPPRELSARSPQFGRFAMSHDITSQYSEVGRSIEELSADPRAYMTHARNVRRQEAQILVRSELHRIAAERPMSTTDWLTRGMIILALVGLAVSFLALSLSLIFIR